MEKRVLVLMVRRIDGREFAGMEMEDGAGGGQKRAGCPWKV